MSILKKYKIPAFAAVFIAALMLLCRLVFLYGDDYFYGQFTQNGIKEFFNSHAEHYMQTNGRAVVHFLVSIILYFDIYLWRILNPFLIFFTIFFAAKILNAPHNQDNFYPLVIFASFFLCLDINIMRETALWLDGSFNYIFPLLLTFSAYYIFNKGLQSDKKYIYLPVLCFFAGATTEQSGIMFAGLLVICFTAHIIKKSKIRFIYILSLITAAAGYLTVILSPGITRRFEIDGTSLSIENINTVFYFFMTDSASSIFIILTALSAILFLAFVYIRRINILSKIADIAVFAALIIFLCFYVQILSGHLDWSNNYIKFLCLTALFIASVSYAYISFFIFTGDINPLAFFLASIGGQAALVYSAQGRYRTIFYSLVFLFVPVISILIYSAGKIKLKQFISAGLLVFIFSAGIYNYITLINGYAKNYDINKENIAVAAYIRGNQEQLQSDGVSILDLIKPFDDELYAFAPLEQSPWHLIQFMKYYNIYGSVKIFNQGENNRFIINGEYIQAMYNPILIDGICYIPIRDFAEDIITGYIVEWIDDTRTIVIKKGGAVIFEAVRGRSSIMLDGGQVRLEARSQSVFGKSFFPADIISKGFGLDYKIEKNNLDGYDIIINKN